MTTLTFKNLDDNLEKQLKINAKKHNCSIEEEVYRILNQALFPIEKQKKLGSRLHQQIKEFTSDTEFEIPSRSLPRTAPNFSDNTQ